tara:strand:+ start:1466 stop:3196 length:1731 start_codon:yes stop_codon:yes gene_type:complete
LTISNHQYNHLVPQTLRENLNFRRELLQAAAGSPETQAELWKMCNRDIFFYINAFGYTLDPRLEPAARPFILYPFQEEAIDAMVESIETGHDLAMVKSRDMGASWLSTTVFAWYWHFKPLKSLLLVSRKEGLVDSPGNSASLFSKIDFFLEHLPGWLVPNYTRTKLRLTNDDNGSAITGESTTGDVARGDRKTCIALDEFASVENGGQVLAATADATNSRWFISTPKGSGNVFYDIVHSKRTKTLEFHWTQDPRKNSGLEYGPDGKPTSPWYRKEVQRRTHPVEIAQELDLDFAGSEYLFFPQEVLEKANANIKPPLRCVSVEHDQSGRLLSVSTHPKAPLQLWVELDERNNPPLDCDYVVGADIAAGTGSSNSVATVVRRKDGEKVAEFCSANMRPDQFARAVVAICRMFRGKSETGAYLIWEANGPGRIFGDVVMEIGYGHVYYRRNEKSISSKTSDIPGWYSTKEEKIALLGNYRRLLSNGKFINRSREALKECLEYVFTQAGGVVHSRSRNGLDPSGAKDNHGDRVIADSLAAKLIETAPAPMIKEAKQSEYGSLAHRRESRKNSRKKAKQW